LKVHKAEHNFIWR